MRGDEEGLDHQKYGQAFRRNVTVALVMLLLPHVFMNVDFLKGRTALSAI